MRITKVALLALLAMSFQSAFAMKPPPPIKAKPVLDVSKISRFNKNLKINQIAGSKRPPRFALPTCASTFTTGINAAKQELNQCVSKIDGDFDAMSTSQLINFCGSKTIQACYNDFVSSHTTSCQAAYHQKWATLVKDGFACAATEAHNKYCTDVYAPISDELENAAKAIPGCQVGGGDWTEAQHTSWCKGLAVAQRGEPKKQLANRKNDLKRCIDNLKK